MNDTIRVMDIYHDSSVDGEGLRSVLFVAGCPHHCKGCQNPQSWEMKNGYPMTIKEIFDELMSNELTDVTFSGGEPFIYAKELSELAEMLKAEGKNIWCWSGFTYEKILRLRTPFVHKLLMNIDVLVDGQFVLELRDLNLHWRGSSNQRVLELKDGKIVKQLY